MGRFFGPIRAIVPLVAGLLHMPPHRFYIANVLSALIWAPAYLLPGMLLGEAAQDGGLKVLVWPAGALAIVLAVWFLIDRLRLKRR
jgi:membrane protein DedA with SNARE-associated domain